MKILAIADEECKALWDYFTPDKLAGVDLIIACGDLNRHYLEYLATMAPMPVLYVHGNHDESYDLRPPQGVICIDDDVYVHNGLRIAGLGGGCRYRTGAWQFTEAEMKKRVNRLRGKIDRHGGLDILVTHAPMHGYGDLTDLPHRGFTAFSVLLDRYHPQLMLHGHILFSAEAAADKHIFNLAVRKIDAEHRRALVLRGVRALVSGQELHAAVVKWNCYTAFRLQKSVLRPRGLKLFV